MCHWVLQELAHQFVDTTVEGGREQKTLTFTRCLFKNASDMFEEAEFSHVIGLVQDGDLNCVEFNLSRFH